VDGVFGRDTVPTFSEPSGRDRFTTAEEILRFFQKCDQQEDNRRDYRVEERIDSPAQVHGGIPGRDDSLYLCRQDQEWRSYQDTFDRDAVEGIKSLPSYGNDDYFFPAKPNVRFKSKEDFKQPYAWDLGKRFRRVCKLAGITDLRIHDLRHLATTVLFMDEIPDAMIAKVTGHRSRELRKYQHVSPEFKRQTVEK
jgi:hypothetical protein